MAHQFNEKNGNENSSKQFFTHSCIDSIRKNVYLLLLGSNYNDREIIHELVRRVMIPNGDFNDTRVMGRNIAES